MTRKNRTKAKKSTAKRRLRALDMRRSGLTYQQIGDQSGVSHKSAYRLVELVLEPQYSEAQIMSEQLARLPSEADLSCYDTLEEDPRWCSYDWDFLLHERSV